MPKMGVIYLTQKQFDSMKIKKYDKYDNPKIWISEGTLYKKDDFDLIKRYKNYFELFREIEELKNCVFPENMFLVDGKYKGYTTEYFEDYKSINFRMYKNKYSINDKKKIMKKIVKLLRKLNEYDIVHADLNTSNIICNSKDVKLIDFDRIKIKEYEDNIIYNWRLDDQIYYLNIALLTVLFDVDLISINTNSFYELVDGINFSNEFKQYLFNCLNHKEIQISKELPKYIDSIRRCDIVKGKEMIKALKI